MLIKKREMKLNYFPFELEEEDDDENESEDVDDDVVADPFDKSISDFFDSSIFMFVVGRIGCSSFCSFSSELDDELDEVDVFVFCCCGGCGIDF